MHSVHGRNLAVMMYKAELESEFASLLMLADIDNDKKRKR
jgi:hypothetical protein